jgi:hypothetical protein
MVLRVKLNDLLISVEIVRRDKSKPPVTALLSYFSSPVRESAILLCEFKFEG